MSITRTKTKTSHTGCWSTTNTNTNNTIFHPTLLNYYELRILPVSSKLPRPGGGMVLSHQRNMNGDTPDIERRFARSIPLNLNESMTTVDKTTRTKSFAYLIGCTPITINATKIYKQQSTGTAATMARATRGIEQ